MRNYPILTTKLNRLRYFQTYFKRERLEKLLDENSEKFTTLIIAGAGYEKSLLVRQWINNKQVVWSSCYANTDSNEQIDVLSRKKKGWIIVSKFIFKS